ncbi:hypothetical protein A3F03_00080 [Candidatus Roizmanbacteria bacterium RIFCSPHIGHO2_12_FULL_41_11]|uniref:POTRA domain-containing protein n=2 Tax=Candidatus Roizmaniibacteriota TaxID=1752723 RepID=A0A1F7JQG6_9BACT|nr:MAG: hypothetical protein A3F03_00080 [Candidatus Roizmanbacteria bacterium RIFCSPHIGHO2_12_FULL_41_11]OGK57838.1 MAG: hypothetical protein A3H86_01750 [Candidatus Roizmanbacteria bacterium RIFCSPLOWO2_02_FULL_41_9]
MISRLQRLSSKLSFKSKIGYLIIILAAAGVAGGAWFGYHRFSVAKINVQFDRPYKFKLIGLDYINKQNLLWLDTKAMSRIIVTQNSWVLQAKVEKVYPNTIYLYVSITQPLAYLQSDDGYFLLSENGRIVDKLKNIAAKLPVISYYQRFSYADISVGNYLSSKDLRDSLYFLDKINSLGFTINSIDIASFHMLGLYTIDNKQFLFSAEKDKEIQIYQVEEICKEFKIKGKEFQIIDVRFDKPVVTQ